MDNELLVELINEFKIHRKIEEVTIGSINDNIDKIRIEIKEQRKHFDVLIENNRDHFDLKIAKCNDQITSMLRNDYATKAEIQSLRDETILEQTNIGSKAIVEAKTDILARVRNYMAIVSGTILLLVAILTYIFEHLEGT